MAVCINQHSGAGTKRQVTTVAPAWEIVFAPRTSSPGQRLSIASKIGDAMNIDENVPVTTPNVMTMANPLMTLPAKNSNAKVATRVVPEVRIVRGSVSLMLLLRRSRQRFVDASIENLVNALASVFLEILSHPIKCHDRVVQRISNDGEQACHDDE